MINIAIIPGDKREEVLIDNLAQKGYSLSVLKQEIENKDLEKKETVKKDSLINYEPNIKRLVQQADLVIAPMSSTDEHGYLKSNFIKEKLRLDESFFDLFQLNTMFLIGIARPKVKDLLNAKGIKYLELARLADLAILNAIPTAEGAIEIAIANTPFTLFNSNTLVTGLGKVGLTLARRLQLLGANSYAVTRDKEAIARGKDLGLKMLNYDQLEEYLPKINIIFNTVPALIIKNKQINLLKKDTLIVDLASSPGGTDFKAAEKKGIKAILALGLPGKVAPLTAGEILSAKVLEIIKENF